jgi:hypothetical protein
MPYRQLSQQETDVIVEKRRRVKDEYGIDWYLASEIVKAIFGKKGLVRISHQFTPNDPVSPDSYVIPMGKLLGYSIGYGRKGKRGAALSTTWQGKSYRDAFLALANDYARRGAKAYNKVEAVLMAYDMW